MADHTLPEGWMSSWHGIMNILYGRDLLIYWKRKIDECLPIGRRSREQQDKADITDDPEKLKSIEMKIRERVFEAQKVDFENEIEKVFLMKKFKGKTARTECR
jgi:hypothetical protein